MSNEIVKRGDDLRVFFEQNTDKLMKILPKRIDPVRFTAIALDTIWKNEKLQECDRYSLFKAVTDIAQLGLEVGSYRGQACILPYWNGKKQCFEAKAQVMYQGLIDLAAESDNVIDIRARIVFEKDEFNVEFGLEEKLIHKPYMGDDAGKPTHCYAVIRYKDGTRAFEVMTKEQIEKIKAKSKAVQKGYDTPWNDPVAELEMWKKTVIKRLLKVVPKQIDKVREAINKDEELEFGPIQHSISAQLEKKTEAKAKELAEKIDPQSQETQEPEAQEEGKCPDCGYPVSVCGCKREDEAPKKKGRPKKEPEQMEIK